MQLDITGIKPAEILFAFSQDQQMDSRSGCIGLLADRRRMTEFCAHHPETALGSGCEAEYGVKLRTASRTYLLRCDPREGKINFNLYAYETPLLEHCVERLARQRPAPVNTRGEAR